MDELWVRFCAYSQYTFYIAYIAIAYAYSVSIKNVKKTTDTNCSILFLELLQPLL